MKFDTVNRAGLAITFGLMRFLLVLLIALSASPIAFADGPQLVLKDVQCPQSPVGKFSISWEGQWSGMKEGTQVRFAIVDNNQRQLIIKDDTVSINGSRRWSAEAQLPANVSLASGYSFALEAYWKGPTRWEASQDKSWRVICSYPSLITAQPVTNVVTPVTAPAQPSTPTSSALGDLGPLVIIGGATLLTLAVIVTRRRTASHSRRSRRNIFRRRR